MVIATLLSIATPLPKWLRVHIQKANIRLLQFKRGDAIEIGRLLSFVAVRIRF